MKAKILIPILVLALFLIIGAGSGIGMFVMRVPHEFWDRMLPMPDGEMKLVFIKGGLNARQCAQAFFEQGALTDSPIELARWMARFGIDRKIRPGRYRVHRSGAWDMARQLNLAKPASLSLTIVPGVDVFSLREVFDESSNPSFPEDPESGDLLHQALLDDMNFPEPMREYLNQSEESRIAFLLPETYFVTERSPEELVRVASRAWWDVFGGELSGDVASADLDKKAIVASMLQREALWDDERGAIAGVIENRIKKNMMLQIDATVIYAWKLKGKKLTRVLYSDLELDSPYNTYVSAGLPPGPICIPSAESWAAAWTPQENKYYYYVARNNGYHYFAETYDGHRTNIKKARSE